MDIQLIMWSLFWIIVAAALYFDLAVLNKHKGNVKTQEAVAMVLVWTGLAVFFGLIVYYIFGYEKALEYIVGYIIEYSLSVDNMFVFLIFFTCFAIPKPNQSKILVCGITGAVAFRFLFVAGGVKLINSFSWITYILGTVLIYTAVKMIFKKNEKVHPYNNIVYRILKKLFRFKYDTKINKFFVRENNVLYATPMFAVAVIIEMSDIVFAIDSISAVLAVSRDTFIIYTSNIFAVIGLRSLYFPIECFSKKFKFLQFGAAVILIFVGLKMILSYYINISTIISLLIVAAILTLSIIISYIHTKTLHVK
ncbi:MAG: TerC/Alx family metal homeostasis membrane protein [Endomicrobium sp.]|jgi:tellurite resistance protein TerC|nr:TerC/Alx family metal homeostasis membrane protein [Endomicrobium sp.]